jgi:uncharacterized protein HemY
MSFIVFILLIILIIILFALSFVSSVLRWIFGLGRRAGNAFSGSNSQKTTYQKSTRRRKIFDKSDGEYVDFEEITCQNQDLQD